jgi:two-component system, sensor histidine kinase PdtaS
VGAAVALIITLLVLFVAVLAFTLYQAYKDAGQRALDHAASASQVVATDANWIVELAKQALRRIDDELGPAIAENSSKMVRDIREAVDDLPGAVKVYVVDAQGRTILSTDPLVAPLDIKDREYFSALAAGERFHTSSLIVSRLNGEQSFVFSRRLQRDGRFAGAAILSYDVKMLRDIWSSLSFDEESTVSLIRNDGMLVARYPPAPGPLDMSKYILFTDYLKQSPSGTYRAVSPSDGVARFVGYRAVPGTSLVAVASVGVKAAYAPFWRLAELTLLLGLPVALALAGGAIWIVRLLMRDEKRKGELERTLEINKLLFRDTHHRVKNNLQSVQSLVSMQNIPKAAKADLQGRIAAMTAVHEHIYRLDRYSDVAAEQFIPDIVAPVLKTFGGEADAVYDLDPIIVDRDHATPLALLVNEVVTNALKYGYPDGRPAKIHITLKHQGERSHLTIADDGVGFDPAAVTAGMGMRLIHAMVSQLHGSYAYTNGRGASFAADIILKQHAGAIGT